MPAPVAKAGSQPAAAPIGRAASQPAPAMYNHQAAGWRRRWPIAVAAVALVAISFSAGMLIERSSSDKGKSDSEIDDKKSEKTDATSPKLGGPKGNKNSAQPQASLPTTAPAVDAFQGTVISTVCTRLHSCGMLNDFSKQMCEEMARKASDPTARSRVKSGQCTYNKSAATSCLSTIKKLSCNVKSTDVMAWVDSAGKLADCTSAFRCR